MKIRDIFAGFGVLSLLILIGILAFGYESPTVVNEIYDENGNAQFTLYCYDLTNNIQAPHNYIYYEEVNNKLIIHNVKTDSFTGSSMQPTIWTGNRLIIKEYNRDYDVLKEGMIIMYKTESGLVVHRIKAIYYSHILTQGDNLYEQSEKIKYEDVKYIIQGVLYV